MSARLTRPPTGKSNASYSVRPREEGGVSRPMSGRSPRLEALSVRSGDGARPGSARASVRASARGVQFGGPETLSARSNASNASNASSTAAFLLTKSKDFADKQKEMARALTENLGDYNEYSRPRPSLNYPLRSVLLDPESNNFHPSKTRTELMKRIKESGMPHKSYDIDGDGWVSREDYFISKRFDLDGNGIIDPDEKLIAKKIVAEEFFADHKDHMHLFGKKYADKTVKQNVNNLANSNVFERAYNKLKAIEQKLKQGGSNEMIEGMTLADKRLLKYNFFCDKSDTSAWNDFQGIPRAESFVLPSNGSRRQMLFTRKQADIDRNQTLFGDRGPSKAISWGRTATITDPKVEND
jgi:hypothetical protein